MKRGTPDHPKTEALAEAIVERWPMPMPLAIDAACGMLERLWHWTAKYAPTGAFRDTPFRRVLAKIGWPNENVDECRDVLLACRWLDDVEGVGLVVHDWKDHADDTTRKALESAELTFWDGTPARRPRPEKGERVATQSKAAREPVANDSRSDRERRANDSPPPRQGSGSGLGSGAVGESAPTVAAGTDPLPEPELVDPELEQLLVEAFARFPHFRGHPWRAVVSLVWAQAKDGPPPARKLDALDELVGRYPLLRFVRALRKYLAEKTEKYGLEDLVAHLKDYAPPERKPPVSAAATIPDAKPERTESERARVSHLADPRNWPKKARA